MKMTQPARGVTMRDEIVPLTADLRRLHVTVSRQFLRELNIAKDGISHVIPNATTEQVLQAAVRLLLEKQAKARGQVKRPRTTLPLAAPRAKAPAGDAAVTQDGALCCLHEGPAAAAPASQQTSPPFALLQADPPPTDPPTTEPLAPRRSGPREAIPVTVRRAVWARDHGRCAWPLDGGGCCGSTHRLELDHIIPWAEWGPSTLENLRVVCALHNAVAARQAFGERVVGRYVGGRARSSG